MIWRLIRISIEHQIRTQNYFYKNCIFLMKQIEEHKKHEWKWPNATNLEWSTR